MDFVKRAWYFGEQISKIEAGGIPDVKPPSRGPRNAWCYTFISSELYCISSKQGWFYFDPYRDVVWLSLGLLLCSSDLVIYYGRQLDAIDILLVEQNKLMSTVIHC
jgi:hypothetical protein